MNEIISLPTGKLAPNDYNPNEMTGGEFAELVTELKHLGRLPKPIIVRPNGTDYVIVDGEHNWRAAQEAEFAEVLCEVVEVDDFEAMRQTYKRNQHGTHNPVLLGQMFQRMKDERQLSNRALAKEMEVSEATIRNALLYADMVEEVRNDYAVEKLTVQQVRLAKLLPPITKNLWIASGADIPTLFNTISESKNEFLTSSHQAAIEEFLAEHGPWQWEKNSSATEAYLAKYRIIERQGILQDYFPNIENQVEDSDDFKRLYHKAIEWQELESKRLGGWYMQDFTELCQQWRRFVQSFLTRFRPSALNYLDPLLASIFDTEEKRFLITPEEFEGIIRGDEYQNTKHLTDLVRLAVYEKHGRYIEGDHDYYDHKETFEDKLKEVEINELAPDYIKESPLATFIKYDLWKARGPEWAKQELAKKSYISTPQQEVQELVKRVEDKERQDQVEKEYNESSNLDYAKKIAEIVRPDDETRLNAMSETLVALEKEELFFLYQAVSKLKAATDKANTNSELKAELQRIDIEMDRLVGRKRSLGIWW
jgi:ParB/RepB/Spo0J family partition protein